MGEVNDAVSWLHVTWIAVLLVAVFVVAANSCERMALCEERGGVMVHGQCLRADALEDLR